MTSYSQITVQTSWAAPFYLGRKMEKKAFTKTDQNTVYEEKAEFLYF